MDFNDLQKHLDEMMRERNRRSIPEFEGYSPVQMHQILHFTFQSQSPVRLKKMSPEDYTQVPMLLQMKYYLNLIAENEPVKLTKTKSLPTKMVKEVYTQGHLKEWTYEKGYTTRFRESDSKTVELTRILAEIAELTKEHNGKLSLTKSGKKLMRQDQKLLDLIFQTHFKEFNWSFFDRYKIEELGQMGAGFSLILLKKYGKNKRKNKFYARKYLKAFPHLLELIPKFSWITREEYASDCYNSRTFQRFLDYYGLINIEGKDDIWQSEKLIRKTPLFDKFIRVVPPKKASQSN